MRTPQRLPSQGSTIAEVLAEGRTFSRVNSQGGRAQRDEGSNVGIADRRTAPAGCVVRIVGEGSESEVDGRLALLGALDYEVIDSLLEVSLPPQVCRRRYATEVYTAPQSAVHDSAMIAAGEDHRSASWQLH